MKHKLTGQEILLAAVVGLMGFFLTIREFILFMNSMNPLVGFAIYEAILFLLLYVLGRGGLVIFKTEIKSLSQTIGLYLVTFAIFITIDWTSAYIQYVTSGGFAGVSSVYMQSEDGITWYLWSLLVPTGTALGVEICRILTYVATPVVLCIMGGYLARGKVRL